LREDDVGNLEVLRTLIVELNRQKEAYSESMTEMEKVAEAQKKLEELNKVFITSIEGLGSTLENSFVDALSGTKSALDSFKDFSRQLVEEILRTYLRLSIINPIINSAFEGVADEFLVGVLQEVEQYKADNQLWLAKEGLKCLYPIQEEELYQMGH